MKQRRWMLSTREIDRIMVDSAGTTSANQVYDRYGEQNGRPFYQASGATIQWSASPARWELKVGSTVMYASTSDTMSPLQASGWIAVSGTGPVPSIEADTSDSYTTEVFPANTAAVGYTWERNKDKRQAFFRKKLSTSLVFVGADFNRFWGLRRRNPCAPIYIRQEQLEGGGLWRIAWAGEFSAASMDFDLDKCTCSVRPEVVDQYSCVIKALSRRVNLMDVGVVTAKALSLPSLEWGACLVTLSMSECSEFHDGVGYINEWTAAHSQVWNDPCDSTPYQLGIFWRERVVTTCVGGNPVPPPGSGWVLLTNNCALDGTAVYVRQTTISYTFGDAALGTYDGSTPVPPDDSCAWQYVGDLDPNPFCPGPYPFFVCLSAGTTTDYERGRLLKDCADYLVRRSGCTLDGMVSDLFEWDAPGDAPGYAAGFNYVTGLLNEVAHLVLLQKSDAIDPGASNPATIGELTLDEFFSMMAAFNVFWDIRDGAIRLEHASYWEEQAGMDLSALGKVSEPMAFSSTNANIPIAERPKWAEAQGMDFVGADIEYSGPCVSADAEVEEVQPGNFTTDISFVINDPDEIAKDGFVILATTPAGADYVTIIGTGALSGNYVSNAPMGWANLEDAFWRHNRHLPTGKMNRQPVTFESFRPTVEQKDVMVVCEDPLAFDPTKYVTGAMSRRVDAVGVVHQAKWSDRHERLELTLRYAFL